MDSHEKPGDRTPKAACAERHPLFEDVRCQRLRGHPGPHRASIGTAEKVLEWADREKIAG